MNDTVLAIVAHPDDEALGCGGALARHAIGGDRVVVVFCTDGENARGVDLADPAGRNAAAILAGRSIGVSEHRWLGFDDQRLPEVPLLDFVQRLEREVEDIGASVVYTHALSDLNADHRRVAEAVLTAMRPLPGSPVRRLLNFEIPSSTGWLPGAPVFDPRLWIDTSTTMAAKREALTAYGSEMRPFPHARSMEAVEALASWRGSQVGLVCAEAFEISRVIETVQP